MFMRVDTDVGVFLQAAMTPRGRIDGLGWVKQGEDKNLENALNALAYPDSDAALLTHQVCTGSSTVSVLSLSHLQTRSPAGSQLVGTSSLQLC